jgi:drug/metabolite transporter (DMT)-like permease
VKSNASTHGYLIGALLVVMSAIGFSAKAIFIKLAYRYSVDAVTLLTLRMAIAAPLFALVALWDQRRQSQLVPPLTRQDWGKLAVLGLVGYYLASLFDFIGLLYISAALERLILFLYPTFVVIASALWLGHRLTRAECLALLLSYGGIVIAFGTDLATASADAKVWIGSAWVLLSALCFAGYIIGNGELGKRIGSVRLACLASLVSCAFIVLHVLAIGKADWLWAQPVPVYGYALGMALFSTVLPIVAMSVGIQKIGASNAAMVSTLGPVMTMAMGHVILDEAISWAQLIGAAMVVAGVVALTAQRKTVT